MQKLLVLASAIGTKLRADRPELSMIPSTYFSLYIVLVLLVVCLGASLVRKCPHISIDTEDQVLIALVLKLSNLICGSYFSPFCFRQETQPDLIFLKI